MQISSNPGIQHPIPIQDNEDYPRRSSTIKKVASAATLVLLCAIAGSALALSPEIGICIGLVGGAGLLTLYIANRIFHKGAVPILQKEERIGRAILDTHSKKIDEVVQKIEQEGSQNLSEEELDQIDQLIRGVLKTIQQGLPLDDQQIKSNIDTILQPLPEEKKQGRRVALQQSIQQAYLNHEMKKKGKFVSGSNDELLVLNALGTKIKDDSSYHDKNKIYSIFQSIVQIQLTKDQLGESLPLIKASLEECALKARLETVAITDELQIGKIKEGIAFWKATQAELENLLKNENLQLPNLHNLYSLPKTLEEYKKRFREDQAFLIEEAMKKYVGNKNIVAKFKDPTDSAADFRDFMNRNQAKHLKKDALLANSRKLEQTDPILAGTESFYRMWGNFLKVEFNQALNPHEALGSGVCWALCHKLQKFSQANPDQDFYKLKDIIIISAIDRYIQASYSCNVLIDHDLSQTLPAGMKQNTIHKTDLQLIIYDETDGEKWLNRFMTSKSKELTKTNGWVNLHLKMDGSSSHAITLRIDPLRKFVWMMDPNNGFFLFDGEFDQARQQLSSCIKDLIKLHYPTTYQLNMFQYKFS